MRHPEERDGVTGRDLEIREVLHVRLGTAAAVEELVDVEDPHSVPAQRFVCGTRERCARKPTRTGSSILDRWRQAEKGRVLTVSRDRVCGRGECDVIPEHDHLRDHVGDDAEDHEGHDAGCEAHRD